MAAASGDYQVLYTYISSRKIKKPFCLHFHFTSLHFFTSLHNQPAAWAFGSLGFRFAGGGGRWRADMASGGEGFGTERARLAGDGLSTERARLAQGGYRGQGFGTERARLAQGGFLGQFYKRNPFKRNF